MSLYLIRKCPVFGAIYCNYLNYVQISSKVRIIEYDSLVVISSETSKFWPRARPYFNPGLSHKNNYSKYSLKSRFGKTSA